MATYKISTPTGDYQIEAPEGADLSGVIAHLTGGDAPQAPAQPQPDGPGQDAGEEFIRGTTGGASDYVGAAGRYVGDKLSGALAQAGVPMKSGAGDMTFDDAMKAQTRAVGKEQADNPVSAYGAEIAGGVTSPIFRLMAPGAKAGSALLSRLLQYGQQGGRVGMFTGAASARDKNGGLPSADDVAQGATEGAVEGGAAGATLPAIAEMIGGAAQPAINRFFPSTQASAAARTVAKRLADQGQSVDQAEQALQDLGPEAVIADLGKGTQRLADNMAQTPGKTAQLAEDTLDTRAMNRPGRLATSVKANVSPDSFYDVDAAQNASMKKAGPMFQQAYDEHPNLTSPGLQLLVDQEPAIQEAMNQGLKMERMASSTARQKFQPDTFGVVTDFNEAGDPIVSQIQSTPLKLWHATKQGLDNMIEQYRDPTTGNLVLDPEGRQLVGLRKSLDDELKDLTGGPQGTYAQANAAYASPAKLNDALWSGRNFVKGDPEITAQQFGKMTPQEQDAYRSGVAREMIGMARKNGATPTQFKAALKDTEIRDKLKTILPTDDQFNNFVNDVQKELTFQNTLNAVRGGSQTFQRGAEDASNAADTMATVGGAMADAASGNHIGALTKLGRYALRKATQATIPESMRDEIGRMTLSNDPADIAATFAALRNYQGRGAPALPPSALIRGAALFPSGLMVGTSNQKP